MGRWVIILPMYMGVLCSDILYEYDDAKPYSGDANENGARHWIQGWSNEGFD